jgi:hypothetical protein
MLSRLHRSGFPVFSPDRLLASQPHTSFGCASFGYWQMNRPVELAATFVVFDPHPNDFSLGAG